MGRNALYPVTVPPRRVCWLTLNTMYPFDPPIAVAWNVYAYGTVSEWADTVNPSADLRRHCLTPGPPSSGANPDVWAALHVLAVVGECGIHPRRGRRRRDGLQVRGDFVDAVHLDGVPDHVVSTATAVTVNRAVIGVV